MFAVTILGYITCQLHNLVLLLLNRLEQPGKQIRAVPLNSVIQSQLHAQLLHPPSQAQQY